jgi:hypothetical protein
VVLHSITDSIRIPKWSPVCGVTPRVVLLVFDRSAEELGVYPIYLHDAPSSDSNFDDARIGPLVRVLRYGVCFAMKSIKLESGLQLNYPTIPHALSHIWNSYLQTKFTTRVYLLQTPQEGPIPPEDSGSPISPRTSCARVWMYVCVRVQRGGEGGGQEGLATGKEAPPPPPPFLPHPLPPSRSRSLSPESGVWIVNKPPLPHGGRKQRGKRRGSYAALSKG